MLIYIDFNGMTQMRVIGLFGITSVVAGFILVVVKLYRDYGFTWLLHRQLWVPLLAVVLYAILPIDWMVNRYNAAQVKRGNLAPSVQIAAHVVSAEGILPLVELVDCEDPKIRDGVRALLAMWAEDLKNSVGSPLHANLWWDLSRQLAFRAQSSHTLVMDQRWIFSPRSIDREALAELPAFQLPPAKAN